MNNSTAYHQDNVASFNPEILVIAPNSEDGTLQEEFTLTYSIAGGMVPASNASLGVVTITVPFETFPVSDFKIFIFLSHVLYSRIFFILGGD